jgi:hypothetical protein
MVFFSGIPSEAAGPVADSVTPTLISAKAVAAIADSSEASIVFFIICPSPVNRLHKEETLLLTMVSCNSSGQ